MSYRIIVVFKESAYIKLCDYLLQNRELESMAMGFYKTSNCSSILKLLVREVILPKPSDYFQQSRALVSLSPEFMESCFQHCEKHSYHLLDIHTHPWSQQVSFSGIDDREALKKKIPYHEKYLPNIALGFLLVGNTPTSVRARVWDKTSGQLFDIPKIILI